MTRSLGCQPSRWPGPPRPLLISVLVVPAGLELGTATGKCSSTDQGTVTQPPQWLGLATATGELLYWPGHSDPVYTVTGAGHCYRWAPPLTRARWPSLHSDWGWPLPQVSSSTDQGTVTQPTQWLGLATATDELLHWPGYSDPVYTVTGAGHCHRWAPLLTRAQWPSLHSDWGWPLLQVSSSTDQGTVTQPTQWLGLATATGELLHWPGYSDPVYTVTGAGHCHRWAPLLTRAQWPSLHSDWGWPLLQVSSSTDQGTVTQSTQWLGLATATGELLYWPGHSDPVYTVTGAGHCYRWAPPLTRAQWPSLHSDWGWPLLQVSSSTDQGTMTQPTQWLGLATATGELLYWPGHSDPVYTVTGAGHCFRWAPLLTRAQWPSLHSDWGWPLLQVSSSTDQGTVTQSTQWLGAGHCYKWAPLKWIGWKH